MRKNLLFLAVAIITSAMSISAQDVLLVDPASGTIINDDTLTFEHFRDTVNFESDFEHKEFVSVINNTQSAMDIDLIREEIQIIPGTGDYFCWGTQCLLERQAGNTRVWQANDPVSTNAQDTAGGLAPLSIYFSPNAHSNVGTAIYKYTFIDINTNKLASVFVKWVIKYPVLTADPIILYSENNVMQNGDTLTFTHAVDTSEAFPQDPEKKKFVRVFNSTNDTMDIDLIREEIQIIPGSGDYYCWGTQCLLEKQAGTLPVWQANDPVVTAPNDTAGGAAPLSIYISPNNNVGTAIFKYTFTDLRTRVSSDIFVKWDLTYITSIPKNNLSNKVSLGPNPAKNTTKISLDNPLTYNSQTVEVIDILGQRVKSINLSKGISSFELNVEDLKSGIYFVTILGDGFKVASKKLVVE